MSVASKLKLLTTKLSKASSSSSKPTPTNNNDASNRLFDSNEAKSQLEVATSVVNTTSLEEENNELRLQVTKLKSSESKLKSEVMNYITEITNLKKMNEDGYKLARQEVNQIPKEIQLNNERESLGNPKVNFDMTLNGAPHGRIVFELYADTQPRLAEIFRALCAGEKILPGTDRLVSYKGTEIVYVGYGQLMYGGNVSVKNRAEFESIYGHISDIEILTRREATGNGGDLFIKIDYDEEEKKTHSFMISGSNSYKYGKCLFTDFAVIGRVVEGIDAVDNPTNYGIPQGCLDEGTFVISDCGQLFF